MEAIYLPFIADGYELSNILLFLLSPSVISVSLHLSFTVPACFWLHMYLLSHFSLHILVWAPSTACLYYQYPSLYSAVLMCIRNPIIHPFVVSLFSILVYCDNPSLPCSTSPLSLLHPHSSHPTFRSLSGGLWQLVVLLAHTSLSHTWPFTSFCSSPCLQGLKSEQICNHCHWFSRQPGSHTGSELADDRKPQT